MSTPTQSKLIDIEGISSTGGGEHFPSVWKAVANMAAQKGKTRHEALDELLKVISPRLSLLVAFIQATSLKDPDLSLRARIVETFANVLRLDAQKTMPFAPPTIAGDALLLAEIKTTISLLRIS